MFTNQTGQFRVVQDVRSQMKNRFIIAAIVLLLLPLTTSHADTFRVGVRAHHGIYQATLQWQATFDYLTKKIPGHKFVMVPIVSLRELQQQVAQKKFDFVLTNPSSYVEMEVRYGASAILTLRNNLHGRPYSQFGSVIFTLKKRSDINTIADLKGKRLVAVSEPAFGGWRVAQREMLLAGFDPYRQAKSISFSGGIQQDVVRIVQLGNADVGIIRTDTLERMAEEKKISLVDFKIINERASIDFPFLLSTRLYPEWALVRLRHTPIDISKQVALALLTMSPAEEPAVKGKYTGWTVPEDYQPVHELMKDLRIGPYKNYYENPLEHFLSTYFWQISFAAIALLVLLILFLYIYHINRKLNLATAEQEKLMAELEQRVEQRTRDLMESKQQAERANEAKTLFLANMRHELRTPLNAVLGYAQVIEHYAEIKNDREIKENIDEILFAGHHLLEIINDILDLENAEQGTFYIDMQVIDPLPVCQSVIALMQNQARENDIEIRFTSRIEGEVLIQADPRLLKQVLINLLSNAIKYNFPQGSVDIIVKQTDKGFCRMDIIDTGEGIDKKLQEQIFDSFQRVSYRQDIPGTGIGLTITRNLVEAMEGRIILESEPGKGSMFSVFFCLAEDE